MKIFDTIPIKGWSFSVFKKENISPFEKLFEIFKELITYTSGAVSYTHLRAHETS